MTIEADFMRDINRSKDADRNSRKRGLQKLCDSLPWDDKKLRLELQGFIQAHLYCVVQTAIADAVEKCRECALKMVNLILKVWSDVPLSTLVDLSTALVSRVNDNPFPEPAEELRQLVVEALQAVVKVVSKRVEGGVEGVGGINQEVRDIYQRILLGCSKALTDNFPNVKRATAELITRICILSPRSVQLGGAKNLLKTLGSNASHQHAKTRIITIQAICHVLTCVSRDGYEEIMQGEGGVGGVLALLEKGVMDRTPVVRVEISEVLSRLLQFRISLCTSLRTALSTSDLQVLLLLLLLAGEETEGVRAAGRAGIETGVAGYREDRIPLRGSAAEEENKDIEDGEMALQEAGKDEETIPIDLAEGQEDADKPPLPPATPTDVLTRYLPELTQMLLKGCESWVAEVRICYVHGLHTLLSYPPSSSLPLILPPLFASLTTLIRDDEAAVRKGAEECAKNVGDRVGLSMWRGVLTPLILGKGGEGVGVKSGALRVATCLLQGAKGSCDVSEVEEWIREVFWHRPTLAHRETGIREGGVLLLRSVLSFLGSSTLPPQLLVTFLIPLLYFGGRGVGEDELVSVGAKKELVRLSSMGGPTNSSSLSSFLERMFYPFYRFVVLQQDWTGNNWVGEGVVVGKELFSCPKLPTSPIQWTSDAPDKIAFILYLTESPRVWQHFSLLLPVFQPLTQPSSGPPAGSHEANLHMYASQRGEEDLSTPVQDVRLQMLALIEGMIRGGAAGDSGFSGEEYDPHLTSAASPLLTEILLPNLVWRVGRVESTVRKVALAATYALLRAGKEELGDGAATWTGGVRREVLAELASRLAPLLVSNLDDMETSPRLMALLSLNVLFKRLKGLWGPESLLQLYPPLVARLDDTSDEVRIQACASLQSFCIAGSEPGYYKGTMLTYIVEQLFIHLDDPRGDIQRAVKAVLLCIGRVIDKDSVLKKAQEQRSCHRSPTMCDFILNELAND